MVPLTDSFVAVVLELAPDGIAVTDEFGRILHANGYFEELFGYSREALAGQTVEMLLPEGLRAGHREHRHDFDQMPAARSMGTGLDLWGRHADGTEFAVEVGLSPVSTQDGGRTIMAVRRISDRDGRDDQAADDRAVQADHDRMAILLNDQVIQAIFSASLKLHGMLGAANVRQLATLYPAIDQLDGAIHDLRNILFDHHPARTATPNAERGPHPARHATA
jgi:PAS domain S-box-containing protein